jgi:hypothetical protein
MTEIIFVHTAWHYKTYEDFFRLAALSGYPVIPLSELNPADDSKTYVITPLNGEWSAGWDSPRARIIHHDLEWRHAHDYPHIPGVSEVWASDAWYAMQTGARYVTLGSHPDLPLHPLPEKPEPPKWDVAFLAYMNPRRAMISAQLQQMGLTIAPNGWDEQRHDILTHVRAMVHVHQWDEFRCIAPQRWAVAAAYRLPIISEECFAFDEASDVNLVLRRGHEQPLAYIADQLYQHLCIEKPFRKCVDAAVEALEKFGVV